MPKKNAPVAAAPALPVYTSLTSLLKAKTLGKTPKGMKCVVGAGRAFFKVKEHVVFDMGSTEFAMAMAKAMGFTIAK